MTADELLGQHLERFGRGDIDGLMSEYADDVTFFTQQGVLRGKDAIRPLFEAMIEEFSLPGVEFELTARHATADHAYIAWRASTPRHTYALGTDTMVVQGGKIVMQSSAVEAAPKG